MAPAPASRCVRAWRAWVVVWFQLIDGAKALGPILHHAIEGMAVIAVFILTWHTVWFAIDVIKAALLFKDAGLLGALAAPLTALFGFVGALQTIVLNKYIAARKEQNGA
jgi:hypothetical protein